jgi:cytochrome bd-type quinol oxidase subunit 1
METVARITAYIDELLRVPVSHGDIAMESLIDTQQQRFAVVSVGWNGAKRVQSLVLYVVVRGDKIVIEHDGTAAPGLAAYLMDHGIPPSAIVLGSQHPNKRRDSAFAIV